MHLPLRIRQVGSLLERYDYPLPFSDFLKDYFKKNPKLGSRDRREIRELAYRYFRLGRNLVELPTEEKLKAAFLVFASAEELACNSGLLSGHLPDGFTDTTPAKRFNLLSAIYRGLAIGNIFPYPNQLNEEFQHPDFYTSLLKQPLVWIKIREGKQDKVAAELNKLSLSPVAQEGLIWGFEADSKLTDTASFKTAFFRIQDHSSQQTGEYFQATAGETWWDCCCGAGGKSLVLTEHEPEVRLFASDARKSIIDNFTARHKAADTRHFQTFVADLSQPLEWDLPPLDGIIADVPCTGAGTWARNPENLLYFKEADIEKYQQRQLSILEHCYPFLKKNKPLVYITCSIFKAENEEVIRRFSALHPVEIVVQKYLSGYRRGAENMFLCRLIKKE